MGKSVGRPKRGQLADMTIPPPHDPPGYELPDPDECEEIVGPEVLAYGHELRTRFVMWKERLIVEFAIIQIVRHNGHWVEVSRIDTCHNAIHQHYLGKKRPADTVGQREILEEIPTENPWAVVDRWYDLALTRMQNDWRDSLRRWRRG